MTPTTLRDSLEHHQIALYAGAVVVGVLVALILPGTERWEGAINPALALMLFVTFLQVPLTELGRAFGQVRFLGAVFVANFYFVPIIVWALMAFAPADPLIRLGVLLVLLCPCIDYVVTFAQMGRADAKLLLASTPILLVAQMLLLPIYLGFFLGAEAAVVVQVGPFVHALIWLIALPLALAALVQILAARSSTVARGTLVLGIAPAPATALVLLIVSAVVVPQLGQAIGPAVRVAPLYLVFALIAPLLGWGVSRLFRLEAPAGRAIAFSAATRNSLVVLPLALAVPGAVPLLPAILVTQTLIELIAQPLMIRLIPLLGGSRGAVVT